MGDLENTSRVIISVTVFANEPGHTYACAEFVHVCVSWCASLVGIDIVSAC